MHYLIARVALKWVKQTMDESIIVYYVSPVILLLRWWPLTPSVTTQFRNGNTWIFVVPMFFGITGDLYQYALWNDCIRIDQLLLVQFLGLSLAFGFMLGFRNYISMPVGKYLFVVYMSNFLQSTPIMRPLVYFLAAIAVWLVIQEGVAMVNVS